MKKFVHAVLFAVLCSFMGMAQGRLSWINSEHDFGTLKEEYGKSRVVMKAVNVGDSAIIITSVATTCGCTTASYTREPIQPNDTAFVMLTYVTTDRPGSFSKQAFVNTNGVPKRYTLRLHGVVEGKKETIDQQYPYTIGALRTDALIIPFGDVMKGKAKVSYIRAYNSSADSLKITFGEVPKHINLNPIPPVIPPFSSCTITAFFNSDAAPLWAWNIDDVVLRAQRLHSQEPADSATINMRGFVSENFSGLSADDMVNAPVIDFESQTIDFGEINSPQTNLKSSFTIKNNGKNKLIIRRIWANNDGVKIIFPEKEKSLKKDDKKLSKKQKKIAEEQNLPKKNEIEILPDESLEIGVEVDKSLLAGAYLSESINVMSNDPLRYKSTLRIAALIKH